MNKVIENIEATEKPTNTNLTLLGWYASSTPCPCSCGNYSLQLIQTTERERNYPARVAIRCQSCEKEGADTCHGKAHAIRRWNWDHDE